MHTPITTSKTVRVITGSAKGIILRVPHEARPVGDMAKSSLFSVIGTDIIAKRVLDLFAGSGALGIEALSRGATHCTFVDNSRYALLDIKSNLDKTHLSDRAVITHQRALPFISDQPDASYDFVFIDPPFEYYKGNAKRVHALLEQIIRIMPPGGAIVLKHPSKIQLPAIPDLTLADSRKFGINTISLWVRMK